VSGEDQETKVNLCGKTSRLARSSSVFEQFPRLQKYRLLVVRKRISIFCATESKTRRALPPMSPQFDEGHQGARAGLVTGFSAALLIVFISGCGQETVNIHETIAPQITSTTPAQGATGVPLNTTITATFNEAMNAATINAASFTLAGAGGVPIAGTVAYVAAGSVATFTPTVILAPSTQFTATITMGVQNQEDPANSLAANYLWTFTTGPAADSTPPTVVSTIPVSAAMGAPVNQVVSSTFSKAMNPATVNATTFTVTGPGRTAITGTVTYAASGSVAKFTPAAPLAYSTTYTATVTTGATDLAGNALAASYVWTFTTGATPDTTPPTVVSTVPVNGASGPSINQAISATFSEAMDPLTITSATVQLTGPGGSLIAGTVAYDPINFIATLTLSAPLAYSTTYTATVTTGATDLAGNALVTNYVWTFTTAAPPDTTPPTVISTIPASAATGVAINQVFSATFSKAMNCATLTSPATTFTVTGPGATAVAGTVNCTGTVATFTPAALLATNTLFTATVTTGAADLAGNALASAFGWSFITVPAPTPPTVISTVPANGAAGVPINQALTATFSEAMNPATINGATFTVTGPGGVAVAGAVTYVAAGSAATFTSAADLASSTVYTATVTTGAMDLAGNALANNFIWTFTTAAAPDTTPPTVISTIPANAASNVPFNQAVSVTFSEAMNPATISSTTFTLEGPGGTTVAGLVTYATIGNAATFTPAADLAPSTLFTATVTTGATDLAGNALATNYVWTFTTGAAPDTTPPTVVSTIPVSVATGVPINQSISATFSEAMDPLTITTATLQLTGPGGSLIAGTVAYDPINFIATLTPSAPLTGNTAYTVTVTTGETDLAGNALASNYVWTFTTAAIVIPPPVDLGTASLFASFGGGAGMTNQGTFTVINGDIGTTGASSLITGFHDSSPGCTYTETPLNIGTVNGAIDTGPPPPTVACPNEGTAVTADIAAMAAADALSAYGALVALPGGLDVSTCPGCGGGSAGELGGRTLAAGIYKSAPGTYAITLGDLTLDAQGDPNAYWVFQMATTLTVGTPSAHEGVILVNGAQAKNVFWQVGSAATINGILGGGTMVGTIISQAAITISTAGVAAVTTINGRVLALAASITMVNTVINVPAP
jgi:Ice-binding-like/Bacterial Ig-like domain